MKISAKFEHDEWVFMYENGLVMFRSEGLDESEALMIVRSINAHEELASVGRALVEASKKFKTYDYAYNSEALDALAVRAESALCEPSITRAVIIR